MLVSAEGGKLNPPPPKKKSHNKDGNQQELNKKNKVAFNVNKTAN